MRFRAISFLLILNTLQLQAQSFSSSVTSSAGDYKVMPGYSLQFTLGEPAIQTYSAGLQVLSEGFQQNTLLINAMDNLSILSGIHVFPNPTSAELFIAFEKFSPEIQATMFDMMGHVLMISEKKIQNQTLSLDISNLVQGSYILQIHDFDNRQQYHYTIVKH